MWMTRQRASNWRRVEADAERTRNKLARERIIIQTGANIDRLKADLAEAESIVKNYGQRIAAAETNQSKGQLERYKRRAIAARDTSKIVIRATEEELDAAKKANKELVQLDKERAQSAKDTERETLRLLDERKRSQKELLQIERSAGAARGRGSGCTPSTPTGDS
jgi:hypothetical protein